MPFEKTPFGELIHSGSVATNVVMLLAKGEVGKRQQNSAGRKDPISKVCDHGE
jgi:hypothetical protein